MMPIQRACGAEMQARNKLSNGPLRVRMKALYVSISQRLGRRYMPGI